jgi:hypothetical protein
MTIREDSEALENKAIMPSQTKRIKPPELKTQVTNLGSVEATLAERGNRYGPFSGHADVTQRLKEVVQSHPKWKYLPRWAREAIDMILHKIGRIMNGDELYEDNWHDIGGYAKLAENECAPERKYRKDNNLVDA